MPYRNGKLQVGKQNTLFYALLIAAFVVWQSIDVRYQKGELSVESKNVDINTLAVCSSTLLILLGFNIKDELFAIAAIVSRNSSYIATLAQQNNIQLEELSEDLKAKENHQDNN